MANRNTLPVDPIIVADQSRQLDKSPQMQYGNIQEIVDDNRPSLEHKIYHFHNCRIADSFNTCTIRMENCGNKVPQVTQAICSSFFVFSLFCPHVMSYHQITGLVAMRRAIKIYLCNPLPYLLWYVDTFHLPLNMLNIYRSPNFNGPSSSK